MFDKFKIRKDDIQYKIENLRHNWKDLLCADAAARVTKRLPRISYWVALTVGVRNIADDEVVPDVTFMDVIHRQFLRIDGVGHEV